MEWVNWEAYGFDTLIPVLTDADWVETDEAGRDRIANFYRELLEF